MFQTHGQRTSDVGWRIRPSLVLENNTGIHKTLLYGNVDARFYDRDSDANAVDGQIGFIHTYEARRDLIFRLQAEASHKTDIYNSGVLITPGGPQVIVSPLQYYQFYAAASVVKSFDRFFVAAGGTVLQITNEDVKDSTGATISQDYRDGVIATTSGRIGAWVSPAFYVFVEPTANQRQFNDSRFSSDGTRVVAGIGSDRISLFRGEIFGGYQEQRYETAAFGTVSGGVFGGRLSWYPTRFWTLSGQVDQVLAESTVFSIGSPVGSATRTVTTQLRSDYSLSQVWSLNTRVGFDHVEYISTPRLDDRWLAGATLNYSVWRNLAITLDYQYVAVDSNISADSFTRSVATVGVTYKY